MKNIFSPLSPLKKIRPNRKLLLVGAYLLVIALLITAVTWRGLLPNPFNILPGAGNRESEANVQQPVETEPTVTPPVLDEEGNVVGETPVVEAEAITPALTLPTEPMQWPLEGTILAGHNDVYRIGNTLRVNVGVDIEAAEGAEIKAAWPGIVDRVARSPRLGWVLEIRHGGGYVTQYANMLEEPYVAVGDDVRLGDVVGKVGATAKLDAASGYYLHFAVYRDDKALDPIQIISPR